MSVEKKDGHGYMARANADSESVVAPKNERLAMVERCEKETHVEVRWSAPEEILMLRWESQVTDFDIYNDGNTKKKEKKHGMATGC